MTEHTKRVVFTMEGRGEAGMVSSDSPSTLSGRISNLLRS